uniref:Non-heme Fe-binding protein n=1 Tax=Pseudomonas syringae TaxID=317 RepID=I6QQK1_PSESX|nr:non-heme Fe-binding protein [Pseudomonas syringae]
MPDTLIASRQALTRLLQSRKMALENIRGLYQEVGDAIHLDLGQLTGLAARLDFPLAYVIDCFDDAGSDLRHRVKICRKQGQFERLRVVGSHKQPAYLYRHVMKTTADKHLMVLRTSPLFTRAEDAPLNGGHQVREIVYVLSGRVGVNWAGKSGKRRSEVLAAGDSIFIESWVPHSFHALEADAQILAVDYA